VFKNVISNLKAHGHEVKIIARNKDLTFNLLKKEKLPFVDRGRGGISLFEKLFYFIKAVWLILIEVNHFKPHLLLSCSSPYLSQVAFISSKPHITINDTDNATLLWKIVAPFSTHIITPLSYQLKSYKKQVRIAGNFELASLHPNKFLPDYMVKSRLGVTADASYYICRFVSHSALHDRFKTFLKEAEKVKLVKELGKHGKVFISSEISLPKELQEYQFPLPPYEMHNAIAFSSLVIGESATMASEAAVLGVPSVFFDPVGRCYTRDEEERYGLTFHFDTTSHAFEKGLEKAIELITTPGIRKLWQTKRQLLLKESIDTTDFLVWFIEAYPDSARIMREDPDYQYRFK
jgi:hypothetical protein